MIFESWNSFENLKNEKSNVIISIKLKSRKFYNFSLVENLQTRPSNFWERSWKSLRGVSCFFLWFKVIHVQCVVIIIKQIKLLWVVSNNNNNFAPYYIHTRLSLLIGDRKERLCFVWLLLLLRVMVKECKIFLIIFHWEIY